MTTKFQIGAACSLAGFGIGIFCVLITMVVTA